MNELAHINIGALLEKMGGESARVAELAEVAREEFSEQLAALIASAQSRKLESIGKCAHAIKGGLGNFEAQKAFELAREVELAARRGDLELALAQLNLLEEEMAGLMVDLDRLGVHA